MTAVLLPLGLAFIMLSLGLGLRPDDFRRVLTRPGVIAVGLFAQVVLLPATGLTIAVVMDLAPQAAVGLMILAACPGGVTAGMVTRLAGGDTALSISLTALTSLLAFVTVPLVVGGSLDHFLGESMPVRLPLGQAVGGLFLITLLPVGIGLALRARQLLSGATINRAHRLATGVFALIVLYTFLDQWPAIREHFGNVGLACLLLNLATMTTGAVLARAVRLPAAGRIALAMECGMQNSALGITLAISLLGLPELAIPSVIYALLMNITAFVFISARHSLRPAAAA